MLDTRVMDLGRDGHAGLMAHGRTGEGLAETLTTHREHIQTLLEEQGALLLRGFTVEDAAGFSVAIDALGWSPLDYVYRSTPRNTVARNVFTATEFPANLSIPLHSENAFQRDWPMHVAFCCLKPATKGGHTPLADLDMVTRALGASLMDEFEARRIQYVRHYQPYVDLPWETVFQTDSRQGLAAYCASHDIDHAWLPDGILRTSQVCQGVATHPARGSRVFFNQAHLFHVTSQGDDAAEALIDLFGEQVPRNAFFGDGSDIPAATLEAIRNAFSEASFSFAWEQGDVLLVDNMRYAHGRQPFTGDRSVVVSLRDARSTIDRPAM